MAARTLPRRAYPWASVTGRPMPAAGHPVSGTRWVPACRPAPRTGPPRNAAVGQLDRDRVPGHGRCGSLSGAAPGRRRAHRRVGRRGDIRGRDFLADTELGRPLRIKRESVEDVVDDIEVGLNAAPGGQQRSQDVSSEGCERLGSVSRAGPGLPRTGPHRKVTGRSHVASLAAAGSVGPSGSSPPWSSRNGGYRSVINAT